MDESSYISPSLLRLADQFRSLPGIGRKSAMRLAFSMLGKSDEEAQAFVDAVNDARTNIKYCKICQNMCEDEICPICSDPTRDRSTICVVEDVRSVMSFEKVREYRGLYHVLHGALSPLSGIGPDKIRIAELLDRVKAGGVNEVIIATNSTVEAKATAMYLSRQLAPLMGKEGRITRLACGMPVGGELEFADEVTLYRALEGRRTL